MTESYIYIYIYIYIYMTESYGKNQRKDFKCINIGHDVFLKCGRLVAIPSTIYDLAHIKNMTRRVIIIIKECD